MAFTGAGVICVAIILVTAASILVSESLAINAPTATTINAVASVMTQPRQGRIMKPRPRTSHPTDRFQRAVADERHADADVRRAVADERRAVADERRAVADERRAVAEHLLCLQIDISIMSA